MFKVITDREPRDLEQRLNEFEEKVDIQSVQYAVTPIGGWNYHYALVRYGTKRVDAVRMPAGGPSA